MGFEVEKLDSYKRPEIDENVFREAVGFIIEHARAQGQKLTTSQVAEEIVKLQALKKMALNGNSVYIRQEPFDPTAEAPSDSGGEKGHPEDQEHKIQNVLNVGRGSSSNSRGLRTLGAAKAASTNRSSR